MSFQTRLKILALCFCLVGIFISTSSLADPDGFLNTRIDRTVAKSDSDGFLNTRIDRTVPKSEAENIIRADEDVTDNPNPGPGVGPGSTPVNSTTLAACQAAAATDRSFVCCMQYTWPGHVMDAHLVTTQAPRNCSDVKEEDREAVCFGPVVYSFPNPTRRPDPILVAEFCEANSHNCFCLGTSCMTHVIYDNGNGEPRRNETHFCGTLRLKNDDSSVTGCYKETKNGLIYEVCACNDGDLCNHSTIALISRTTLIAFLIITALRFLAI